MCNRSFENMPQFRYLRIAATNQNFVQEEIEGRLNCGGAGHNSVQNLYILVSCLNT
jgi:hypothetical protein